MTMDAPEKPDNEAARIASLCSVGVLDTPAEERFDRIIRIASAHFQVPIALVSLVDTDRQWFKSRQGLDAAETPRDISFCGHSILDESIFYVPNALDDPRFSDNPLVTGPPDIRFYAGAPLHTPDGMRIGTLCIIDRQSRVFTNNELSVLRDLADIVEAELGRARLLKVQEELSTTEQRLQHILRLSPGIIYTAHGHERLIFSYISPQMENLLGYKPESMLGNPDIWSNLVHPEDNGKIFDSLHKDDETGTAVFEYRVKRADGGYLWLHDKRHFTSDGDDIVGLWIDITRRKELELESKYYKAIVDSSEDAIISKSLDGFITSWNRAAEQMFGYSSMEVVGKPMEVVFPPDRLHEEKNILGEISLGNKIEHFESTRMHKDRHYIDVSVSVSPIFDQYGSVVGASTIARDITQSKQAEIRLKNSESRIRAIVENVLDGIITIDAKGTVQTMNRAAEQIFGYKSEEVVGENVKMLMPENYSVEHDSYLSNYLTTGNAKVIGIGREVTGLRKDDSVFPMELAVSEMQIEGEHIFTGIVRDITERKKIERMKSEFVSTVSHELRTPLTSIRGALGLVLGRSSDKLPEDVRKMIEMANRNSERLTLLINDILDLEKIESGQLEFTFGEINLGAVARRAIEDNQGFSQEHGVTLEMKNCADSALVLGDEHRLLQVFANLISNAVKFSPKGAKVEISVVLNDRDCHVAVRDYGPGIPYEFRASIFKRFAQADSSDSREKGGTGLGLSISKAIIEHHGGTIGYNSVPGEGAEFGFSLPTLGKRLKSQKIACEKSRAIICEGDADVAAVLEGMIRAEGVTCDIAQTASRTRELIKERKYSLLLLDLLLPDEDGLKLLQELREDPLTRQLPVIVVSRRAQEGKEIFTGDGVMVVDWLQKPVDRERLMHALREALKKVKRPKILHIEDDLDIIQITEDVVGDVAEFSSVPSLQGAKKLLKHNRYDLVILDLGLEDGSGVDLLDELKSLCPVVIFSAKIPNHLSGKVSAALTKSITSNDLLKATIHNVLNEELNGSK